MLKTVGRLVGETFVSAVASGGGDIASRLTLTSEDKDETDRDGPFYLKQETPGLMLGE